MVDGQATAKWATLTRSPRGCYLDFLTFPTEPLPIHLTGQARPPTSPPTPHSPLHPTATYFLGWGGAGCLVCSAFPPDLEVLTLRGTGPLPQGPVTARMGQQWP